MSFSVETKTELTQIAPEKKCCILAEIAGFMRVGGSIRLLGGGRMQIALQTEIPAAARSIIKLLKSYFGVHAELEVEKTNQLKKVNVYHLLIESESDAEQILRETGILGVREGYNYITQGISEHLVKSKCCRKAYLRGLFLGAGTISDPERSYHFEIVCHNEVLGQDVRRLINSFGLSAKMVQRKNSFVVYLKDSEQIVDCLNIMGAHGKLLAFENTRVVKEMRNRTNRIVNCETANVDKTIQAASRQIENIRLIQERRGLATLPDKLREVAELRLAEPEISLQELAELLNPPVGKSGINHRFRKIEEIADQLRK